MQRCTIPIVGTKVRKNNEMTKLCSKKPQQSLIFVKC